MSCDRVCVVQAEGGGAGKEVSTRAVASVGTINKFDVVLVHNLPEHEGCYLATTPK